MVASDAFGLDLLLRLLIIAPAIIALNGRNRLLSGSKMAFREDGRWVVLKFGGTSVSSPERWDRIGQIVGRHTAAGRRVLVVCSAVSGVTNTLEAIVTALAGNADPAPLVADIRRVHLDLASALGLDPSLVRDDLASLDAAIAAAATAPGPRDHAAILAHGELLSTRIGTARLNARGMRATRIDARTLLRSEPDSDRAEAYLSARCDARRHPDVRAALDAIDEQIVVTQGFIARDRQGDTVLLGRGGSDASGAYLAAAIDADLLEIWTDVPGLFTADPRVVPGACLLRRVSYSEAEALGALGAKVLHPRTIEPCRKHGIPIRIGWTDRPDVEGTRIAGARSPHGVKSIAARRGLALLAMWRPSSWQPVGFMAEVAARFQRRGLSMDLISSSPSEIRVTVDLGAFPSAAGELDAVLTDLTEVCRPRLVSRIGCVSVVGAGVVHDLLRRGIGLDVPADAHVHMVNHAANGGHVSFVVDAQDIDRLVAASHDRLIAGASRPSIFGPRWSELVAVPAQARAEDGPREVPCAAS
jgi:diaminopimelate decarboxylase/aspartate kinase